ncbi:MAG: hypothetical protein PHD76_00115 [Methylacidiphilales bacterium]|nr:hypothetical protein [Candidatus Methylacidiphilales bacterium]
MKRNVITVTALAASVLFGFSSAQAAIVDLYTSPAVNGAGGTFSAAVDSAVVSTSFYNGSGGTTNAALLIGDQYFPGSPGLSGSSSGSGTYTRMYAIQDAMARTPGVERGFNSNDGALWDQKNGVGVPAFTIADTSIINYQGTDYVEILFDGHQSNSAISLDQLMIFKAPGDINLNTFEAANPTPTTKQITDAFAAQGATVVYSLDSTDSSGNVTTNNTVLLHTLGGSGHGDNAFYIPVSAITGGTTADLNDRVYVWSQMGGLGTYTLSSGSLSGTTVNFSANSTPEEYAYYKGGTSILTAVPEPTAYAAGVLLLLFIGFSERRRLAAWLKSSLKF